MFQKSFSSKVEVDNCDAEANIDKLQQIMMNSTCKRPRSSCDQELHSSKKRLCTEASESQFMFPSLSSTSLKKPEDLDEVGLFQKEVDVQFTEEQVYNNPTDLCNLGADKSSNRHPVTSDQNMVEICEWPCKVVDNALTPPIALGDLSQPTLSKPDDVDYCTESLMNEKKVRSVTGDFSNYQPADASLISTLGALIKKTM